MADDAGSGLHLLQDPRPQPQVDLGGQIEGDDVGLIERSPEQVLAAELDAVGDAGRLGVGGGFADPGRIDVDAEAAGAVAARRRDQDAAVARAEVDHLVAGPDLGHGEHRIDHRIIGGDVGRVECRTGADERGRIEIGRRRRRLRGQISIDRHRQQHRQHERPHRPAPRAERKKTAFGRTLQILGNCLFPCLARNVTTGPPKKGEAECGEGRFT